MTARALFLRLMLSVCSAGAALHAYTALFKAEGGPSAFTLGLFICASLPYLACAFVGIRFRQVLPATAGALAALIADCWMFRSVFIAPGSSTAAIGLLFMPILNLFVFAPLAALLVFTVAKATRNRSS